MSRRRREYQLEYYVKATPANSSNRYRSTELFTNSEATSLQTRTRYIENPPSPQKRRTATIEDDFTLIPDLPPAPFDSETQHIDPEYIEFFAKQKQDANHHTRPSDNPLEMWIPDAEEYLRELIRLEGRGDSVSYLSCIGCRLAPPHFRCRDCMGTSMYCLSCTLKRHTTSPLHRIQRWNGAFFEPVLLKALGLRVQLGHNAGDPCLNPKPSTGDDFVVLDVHGIHEIGLDYCNCETAQKPTVQLLRNRWFAATVSNPKTAATITLLEHFHHQNFESKASAFQFYRGLMQETDNTGINSPKDRYVHFMRMVRQWRYLKLLKRAGRGHDPTGMLSMNHGDCAVLCPACPQPGKNLPDGWLNSPSETRWLYALFVALDANFRMRRKKVSSSAFDPGLVRGYSYFAEDSAYKMYLSPRWHLPQERSSCSGHRAVNNANTLDTHGLDATGIGAVDCMQHEFKRPCAIGDLQKGERRVTISIVVIVVTPNCVGHFRYINMDYMFFHSLVGIDFSSLVVSYDIACQWSKNLWSRMDSYPPNLQLDHANTNIKFLVPKFHLPAHIDSCQVMYSFNLTPGVGWTDGEAPERGWAHINNVASSTKEMGPGHRRDTLDDHWGNWNWQKITGMGARFLSKICEAVRMEREAMETLEEFETAIKETDQKALDLWWDEVRAWEADKSKPNPYVKRVEEKAQARVRLDLAKEEESHLAGGKDQVHEEVSPSVWLIAGLELEEQQRHIAWLQTQLGEHSTNLQLAKFQEQSNMLLRRIEVWRTIQLLYMPAVAVVLSGAAREQSRNAAAIPPHLQPLYLPAGIKPSIQCSLQLQDFEFRLRFAQANDALDELRHHLRVRTYMYHKKDREARGVAANTRAQTAIRRQQDKIDAAAKKYRVARKALDVLGCRLDRYDWMKQLLKLEDADIRGMTEHRDPGQQREGTRKPSWIWTSVGAVVQAGNDPGLHNALRIEWCKARARAMRWSEEIELLKEEMRRVLQFMLWHEEWWKNKGSRWEGMPAAEAEGLRAYAIRQATLRRALFNASRAQWIKIPELHSPSSRHPEVTGLPLNLPQGA